MRARPEIREHLIARKMKRWALIGRYPSMYPNFSPARARRNYARLISRYPEISKRLRMGPLDAYPPL
jgi:hypothetical protein